MLRKDSRTRFRHIESKEKIEVSDIEDNTDLCILILTDVKYNKPRKKTNFSDFYSVLNDCRRSERKKNAQ